MFSLPTVCPRILDPIYVVLPYVKCVKTSLDRQYMSGIYYKYSEGRTCEVGIPGFDVIGVHLSSQSPLTVLYIPKFNHSFGVRPGLPTFRMPSYVYTYVYALCLHYSDESLLRHAVVYFRSI